MRVRIIGNDAARFLDKTSVSISGCWIWKAATVNGYGQFCFDGRMRRAHIFAYRFFNGPQPKGTEIDHLCRTKLCVNPSHLEVVTHQENMRRAIPHMIERHWARKMTCCKRGHPFSERNTRLTARGHRVCRACKLLEYHRNKRGRTL